MGVEGLGIRQLANQRLCPSSAFVMMFKHHVECHVVWRNSRRRAGIQSEGADVMPPPPIHVKAVLLKAHTPAWIATRVSRRREGDGREGFSRRSRTLQATREGVTPVHCQGDRINFAYTLEIAVVRGSPADDASPRMNYEHSLRFWKGALGGRCWTRCVASPWKPNLNSG